MINKPKFKYDKRGDVLYISFGKPQMCKCIEGGSGIVLRYTASDKSLNGITIIDYAKRVESSGHEQVADTKEEE